MEAYLPVLFWVGIVASSILIIMLLISIIGLGDLDTDFDGDGAGLGFVKSILVFTAVSTLTMRAVALSSGWSWVFILLFGIAAGIGAIFLLSMVLHFLLSRQEEGNWYLADIVNHKGKANIPIATNQLGRIRLIIKGVEREVNARSKDTETIATGQEVRVVEVGKDFVWVTAC